jgi:hypothetical protein
MLDMFLEKSDDVISDLVGWVVAPFHNRSNWAVVYGVALKHFCQGLLDLIT